MGESPLSLVIMQSGHTEDGWGCEKYKNKIHFLQSNLESEELIIFGTHMVPVKEHSDGRKGVTEVRGFEVF